MVLHTKLYLSQSQTKLDALCLGTRGVGDRQLLSYDGFSKEDSAEVPGRGVWEWRHSHIVTARV